MKTIDIEHLTTNSKLKFGLNNVTESHVAENNNNAKIHS